MNDSPTTVAEQSAVQSPGTAQEKSAAQASGAAPVKNTAQDKDAAQAVNALPTVSASPHIRSHDTTVSIMLDVIIAMLPAAIASALIFGYRALIVTAVSTVSCVLFEYISRKVMKRPNTIGDLSAVVTGLLLAFNLPSSIPVWMIPIGAFFAVVVAKQFFGGIGQNFVNPALIGRIVLMVSFPTAMSSWVTASGWNSADAVSAATPLAVLNGTVSGALPVSLSDLFFGKTGGCLGETCALALLLGLIYLLARRVISPAIPCVYIGTTALFMLIAGGGDYHFMLSQVLSGGLLLGAIFMATDYTTSPITLKGKIIYAVGCGLLTAVIRLYGSLPEGVSFSIIIMNILTPLIDRYTKPVPFGFVKEKKGKEAKAQ